MSGTPLPLSRFARDLAAEINYQDWSDAPYRADRAGHQHSDDRRRATGYVPLTPEQTATVRMNVMWIAAQVLSHHDPNFDVYRFAEACGVDTTTPSGRPQSGVITAGLRHDTLGRRSGPILALFCHACDRAIRGRRRDGDLVADQAAGVRRIGLVSAAPERWTWGPVPVHEQCVGDFQPFGTPLDPRLHAARTEIVDYATALHDQHLQDLPATS